MFSRGGNGFARREAWIFLPEGDVNLYRFETLKDPARQVQGTGQVSGLQSSPTGGLSIPKRDVSGGLSNAVRPHSAACGSSSRGGSMGDAGFGMGTTVAATLSLS
ncbi:hypothetical protein CLV41_11181 [Roseibium marinum]|uniref:Uncharacterized protein n=1 Tax=Roseibium marinum TaxID=281252 RepID=A0A2S3UMC4_9HYPH|nr:hypothetical protein CLV41_11181 [Roseibium marinum]